MKLLETITYSVMIMQMINESFYKYTGNTLFTKYISKYNTTLNYNIVNLIEYKNFTKDLSVIMFGLSFFPPSGKAVLSTVYMHPPLKTKS